MRDSVSLSEMEIKINLGDQASLTVTIGAINSNNPVDDDNPLYRYGINNE